MRPDVGASTGRSDPPHRAPATPILRLRLSDGRTLAYATWGDPSGAPIFFFHGTPSSRLELPIDDNACCALGIRLITLDRPGFGASELAPRRTLLDWADDVRAVADALRIGRFAVLGVSGGGPHAAACARRLGDRVSRAGLVSSVSSLQRPGATEGMVPFNRVEFALARRIPLALRPVYAALAHSVRRNPDSFLQRFAAPLGAQDRAILARPDFRSRFVETFAESLGRGVAGYVHEVTLLARPWGFDPGDIRVPCVVWHGSEDRLIPEHHGRHLAAVIPGCAATYHPRDGHFLLFQRGAEILKALVS